ncbi:glycosyl hydrolase family 65 protein [Methylocaldum sp.]|uniref:glycosyl hydrolase family 65 protein n=1 Tax=Methylocaldum sp. TaxID=1969727 RepID=UPI002D61DA24|nr:glycosyl hydrolase family 65 protein [Methylocaldum sp.]HYE35261.1 glycosyl hydrolase family 65 protein [Methylocaldum sp.]
MSTVGPIVTLSPRDYDAVLFDLDGAYFAQYSEQHGIEVAGDVLRLNPQLPEELDRLDMRIRYRRHTLDLHLTRDALTVHGREPGIAPIRLAFKDEVTQRCQAFLV